MYVWIAQDDGPALERTLLPLTGEAATADVLTCCGEVVGA